MLSSINRLCEQIHHKAAYYDETRDRATFENIGRHVELLYQHMLAISDVDDDILSAAAEIASRYCFSTMLQDEISDNFAGTYHSNVHVHIGRPRFDIARDQLEYLFDLKFRHRPTAWRFASNN